MVKFTHFTKAEYKWRGNSAIKRYSKHASRFLIKLQLTTMSVDLVTSDVYFFSPSSLSCPTLTTTSSGKCYFHYCEKCSPDFCYNIFRIKQNFAYFADRLRKYHEISCYSSVNQFLLKRKKKITKREKGGKKKENVPTTKSKIKKIKVQITFW